MNNEDRLSYLEELVDSQGAQIEILKWAVEHLTNLCSESVDKYNSYTDALTKHALQKLKQEQGDG